MRRASTLVRTYTGCADPALPSPPPPPPPLQGLSGDARYMTPLHAAAAGGHAGAVWVIAHALGTHVRAGVFGATPHHSVAAAAQLGRISERAACDTVCALVRAGCAVDIEDACGFAPADLLAYQHIPASVSRRYTLIPQHDLVENLRRLLRVV